MKYLLMIYGDESSWTREEWNQCVSTSMKICEELAAQGKLLSSSPLHPVATATTVRVRNGQRLLTSGPFAETVEQLGGYYMINVADLDEAINIACRLPPVKNGTVEIRPLLPVDGLPTEQITPLPAPSNSSLKKYMLLCFDDEEYWKAAGADVHQTAVREAVALNHELAVRGQFLSSSPLRTSETATCVQIRDNRRIVTDGPFTETREILGGYYLILAQDAQEAIEVAARHPGARHGAVEVRAVFDLNTFSCVTENEQS